MATSHLLLSVRFWVARNVKKGNKWGVDVLLGREVTPMLKDVDCNDGEDSVNQEKVNLIYTFWKPSITMFTIENQRLANSNMLPRRTYLTPPPPCKQNRLCFLRSASSTRGIISATAGEKKNKEMMDNTQESNVTVKDLKKISIAAASAINGGGRKSLGGGGRRTSWRLWCSGLVCVTGTDTSFKQGKSLHQRTMPKCTMMGGDSRPHNFDPDIDRWIMPNIRLQPVLPILINTSFRKMCTKKQGVSIWFHELEALQNEEKLNNLEIKMPEIFGGYITYALKTARKSWLLKLGGSHASHGNVYRLLTFRHLSKAGLMYSVTRFDIIRANQNFKLSNSHVSIRYNDSTLAAIKSTVSDPPQGKYRVMSTIKIVSDVSVSMSMFESQWKAYGWIQGLLSLSQQS
ncbi:unnamed protein product [Brassica oleracea]